MKRAIICDVDGTIALMDFKKRTPFQYIKANEDKPNDNIIRLLLNTAKAEEAFIIFLSARENVTFPTERSKYNTAYDLTESWIRKHVFNDYTGTQWYDNWGISGWQLILRDKGDYRKDCYVKYDLYNKRIKDNYEVFYVFDDRNQVVDMWRNALGLTCLQVADGNF